MFSVRPEHHWWTDVFSPTWANSCNRTSMDDSHLRTDKKVSTSCLNYTKKIGLTHIIRYQTSHPYLARPAVPRTSRCNINCPNCPLFITPSDTSSFRPSPKSPPGPNLKYYPASSTKFDLVPPTCDITIFSSDRSPDSAKVKSIGEMRVGMSRERW